MFNIKLLNSIALLNNTRKMCDMKLLNSIALLNYIRKMGHQTTKMCVCVCEDCMEDCGINYS